MFVPFLKLRYYEKDLFPYPMIDAMEMLDNNIVFILRRPLLDVNDFYQIWFFDANFNFISKHKHIPGADRAGWDMQQAVDYGLCKDGLVYLDFYGDTLFLVSNDREVKPLCRIEYGRMPTKIAQSKGAFEKSRNYNELRGFSVTPPYVSMCLLRSSGTSKILLFNLETQETHILKKKDCPTDLNGSGFFNDITGCNPLRGGMYSQQGFMFRKIERWIIDGYVEPECIEEMSKTYPEIMKRFKKVFSPNKFENNPVIEIILMKK